VRLKLITHASVVGVLHYKCTAKRIAKAEFKRLRLRDTAQIIDDMNIAGYRLHPLKGDEKGRWSIWVNGNWRLTFEFRDGHAYVLDYEDYH
jgi:proteic killer suppression protein